jgi:hypothetical protein
MSLTSLHGGDLKRFVGIPAGITKRTNDVLPLNIDWLPNSIPARQHSDIRQRLASILPPTARKNA